MYTICNIISIDWILSGSFTMIIVLSLQLRLCSLLRRERESETPPSNYERAFCFWLVCKACVDQCYADVRHTTLTNKKRHQRGKEASESPSQVYLVPIIAAKMSESQRSVRWNHSWRAMLKLNHLLCMFKTCAYVRYELRGYTAGVM